MMVAVLLSSMSAGSFHTHRGIRQKAAMCYILGAVVDVCMVKQSGIL